MRDLLLDEIELVIGGGDPEDGDYGGDGPIDLSIPPTPVNTDNPTPVPAPQTPPYNGPTVTGWPPQDPNVPVPPPTTPVTAPNGPGGIVVHIPF